MPIWSKDQSNAKSESHAMGGNKVHFAIDPNRRGNYKDASGNPLNHDRGFMTELPSGAGNRMTQIVNDSIEAGIQVALATQTKVRADMLLAAQQSNQPFFEKNAAGGTTGTVVIFDPKSFTIEIGSRGDSPAFLMLDDGNKTVAVKLTTGIDAHRNVIYSSMNDTQRPTRDGTYQIGNNPVFEGTIDVQTVIDQAVAEHSLNVATLKTHVMVASDGILKPYPLNGDLTMEDEQNMAVTHYTNARQSNPGNLAQGVIDSAISGGSKDNVTVQLIEDIAKGKGKPIAMVVNDGFYAQGFQVADATTKAIEAVMKKEIAKGVMEETQVVKKDNEYRLSIPNARIKSSEKADMLNSLKDEFTKLDPAHSFQMGSHFVRETLVIKNPTKPVRDALEEKTRTQQVGGRF